MTSILITGANRGIGFAMAKAALARGWTVYGSARTEPLAADMAKGLPGLTPLVFDVTDREAVAAAAGKVDGSLDILINNAGIIGPSRQATLDMDFDGFLKTLEVNTVAPLAVSQAFLPKLRASGSGRILSISSQMSWMGYQTSDRIAYRASKSALNKVMQGLATDLEDDGIPVVVIDPGWVKTDMGGSDADNEPERVAEGILSIADKLTISVTGTFFKWTGEERPF
ncbi:SDR family oxidoreductase [Roseibium litorale]|uniref:SDR family oxidoreductase n=1 Tax=Roseibium litorale TaxID=2803841 RepID=A0ABR9CRC2_9HYPH|nr:SDR family oxidoreductase [Roseibium litorale]MBD8893421.1 SDR family oxidoreductase [Roseibium litorale]